MNNTDLTKATPEMALILAAGLGSRLRPHTQTALSCMDAPGDARENWLETAVELAVMYPAFLLRYVDRWP